MAKGMQCARSSSVGLNFQPRAVLRLLIVGLFSLGLLTISAPAHAQNPPLSKKQEADAEQLGWWITSLSRFGANEDGGVDRVAYSQADIDGRAFVMAEMVRLGLENIRIDAGGNIRATRPGTDTSAKPIMFGSHADSVLGGGNYDGPAGVFTALEAIRILNARDVTTRHPLEVIVFSNEEGGLVGSLALIGKLEDKTLNVVSDSGLTIGEGIAAIGGDVDALDTARIHKGDLRGFIELHIEQGAFLDDGDIDIGVVTGIVGIGWWDVTVKGMANHAGTTPMKGRRDALVAASHMVLAVNDVGLNTPGRQVATVGRIKSLPGAPNVIPGEVAFSLEIRDLEAEKIASVYDEIKSRFETIATERGVTVELERIEVAADPALTDPTIRTLIAESADKLGYSSLLMPSGAGHDAQDMARIAPTGMIFIPSKGGISHSPEEFSSNEQLAKGANVLVETVLALDAR